MVRFAKKLGSALIKPTTKGTRTSKKAKVPDTIRLSDIRCKERLGGLLKHYIRAA